MIGDILIIGTVSLFVGSVIANQHVRGGISRTRRRVGDAFAYFGLACWLGGPLWWLFYQ